MRLAGKVAMVTGGGSGIGRRALALEADVTRQALNVDGGAVMH